MKEFIDIIQKRLDIERKSGSPLHDPNPLGIELVPELEEAFAALELLIKANSLTKVGYLFDFEITQPDQIDIPLANRRTLELRYHPTAYSPWTITGPGFSSGYRTSDAFLKGLAKHMGTELGTLGYLDSMLMYSPKSRDVLDIE
jgi:hypothetical protein